MTSCLDRLDEWDIWEGKGWVGILDRIVLNWMHWLITIKLSDAR